MGVSYFLWKWAEGQGSSWFSLIGQKISLQWARSRKPVLASAPSHVLWVSFYQPQTEMLFPTWSLFGICQMSRSQKTGSFSTMLVVPPTVWSRVVRQPGSPSRNFNCQRRNLVRPCHPLSFVHCCAWNGTEIPISTFQGLRVPDIYQTFSSSLQQVSSYPSIVPCNHSPRCWQSLTTFYREIKQ